MREFSDETKKLDEKSDLRNLRLFNCLGKISNVCDCSHSSYMGACPTGMFS